MTTVTTGDGDDGCVRWCRGGRWGKENGRVVVKLGVEGWRVHAPTDGKLWPVVTGRGALIFFLKRNSCVAGVDFFQPQRPALGPPFAACACVCVLVKKVYKTTFWFLREESELCQHTTPPTASSLRLSDSLPQFFGLRHHQPQTNTSNAPQE